MGYRLAAFAGLFLFTAVHADDVTEISYEKATAKGTKSYTCKQPPCEITGYELDLTQKKVVFDPKIYIQADQRVSVVADGKSEFTGFVLNESGQNGVGAYVDIFGKKRNAKRGFSYIEAKERLCTANISGAVDSNCEVQPLIGMSSGTFAMDQNDLNTFTQSYGVLNVVLVGNNSGMQSSSFFPKATNSTTLNQENDLSSLIFRVEHGDLAKTGLYKVTIRVAKNVKVTPPPSEPSEQKQPQKPAPTPSPSPSPKPDKKPPSSDDDPFGDDLGSDF